MNPDTLRAALPPFSAFLPPASAALKAYLAHYNLVIEAELAAQHTVGTLHCSDYCLVAHAFMCHQPRGNALIVHGYMDHTGLYSKLIRHLLAQGLHVYIVDLPGHGLSSGPTASINQFSEYSEAASALHASALAQAYQGPWFLFGQSMGGAIAMSLLQTRQLAFAKTVLLAPLVQPRAWSWLRFVHAAARYVVRSIPRDFSNNSHDATFTTFLAQHDALQTRRIPIAWLNAMRRWRAQFLGYPPSDAPVLVIQGTGDDTVDWRFGNSAIERLFPHCQRVLIEAAKHHLVNEATPYLRQVFAAIDDYLFAGSEQHR